MFFSTSFKIYTKKLNEIKYYRGWFGQPITHFLKSPKKRLNIGQKTLGRVKFHMAVCFTSYFISFFGYFRKWKMAATWILHDRKYRFLILRISSLLSEVILQNDFESQKCGHLLSLVLETQQISNNLNTNKNPMVYSPKDSLNFLSDKLIQSCSVRRR